MRQISSKLFDALQKKFYLQSGPIPGRDVENWTQAEREIFEQAVTQKRRSVIVLKVSGAQYVGEYLPESSDGYVPGEFGIGSPVTVRFEGDKMFVKRANGKELETQVVHKISEKPGVSEELI